MWSLIILVLLYSLSLGSNMLRITVKHGISDFSAETFAVIGAYMTSRGDIKQGHRFGTIGENLLQRCKKNRKYLKGRTYTWIASSTKWWREPILLSLDILIAGYELCMASGSIELACRAYVLYSTYFFDCGFPLGPLLADLEKFTFLLLEYEQAVPFLAITPLWQCLLNLMGESSDPLDMEAGAAFSKLPYGEKAGQKVLYTYWMQLAFFLGNIKKADECAEHLKEEISCLNCGGHFNNEVTDLTRATLYYPTRLFFFALIAIAKIRQGQGSKLMTKKYKVEAESHIKALRALVLAGAVMIAHKVQLLEAELASLSHRASTKNVCKMYNIAIASSTRSRFLHDTALANYLCFQFCVGRREKSARKFLTRSYDLWMAWNAYAVADSLFKRHPEMFGTSSPASIRRSFGQGLGSFKSRLHFSDSLTQQLSMEVSV